MSIRQDPHVRISSKMSERYARWFETRVPSTSPMFRYLLMFCLSIPISLFAAILFVPYLQLGLMIVFASGLGILVYLLYLAFLKTRFFSVIEDKQFSEILESARARVSARENVQVWPRKSTDAYIAPTFNFLFNAVLISDTMIDLIDQTPNSGEAFLAFHLSQTPKGRNLLDIVLGFLPFFIVSSMTAFFFSEMIPYVYLIYLVVYGYTVVIILPFILAFLLKSIAWSHNSAFERIATLYGLHPQIAKEEVVSSRKLDDEAAKGIIWAVREWEGRKRSGRRASISILVLFSVIVIEYLFVLLVFPASAFYLMINRILFLALPCLIGFIIYIVLQRWDRKCMAKLYFAEDAKEPIWVD